MQITSDLLIKDVGCKKTERERERQRDSGCRVAAYGNEQSPMYCVSERKRATTHLDDKRSLLDTDSFT